MAVSATVSSNELSYLDGVSAPLQTQLNAKAALAAPAFTGDPTAPTPITADNDTSLATTAFVKAQGYMTSFSETDPKIGPLTASFIPRWSGSALADSLLYDNGTRIGIGTIDPESMLHIASPAGATLQLSSGASNSSFVKFT